MHEVENKKVLVIGLDASAQAAVRLLVGKKAVVFVAQGQPHIEAFIRGADGVWTLHEATGLDAQLTCATSECSFVFPLAEVYADVAEADFAAAAAEAAAVRSGAQA